MSYDAIVLAAGKNTRLKGIVPSYHKPLVIVNGRPLIVSMVENLRQCVAHIVVMVSPENSVVITELLRDNELLDRRVTLIVQPESRGPGEAILRGMRAVTADRVLIALGDNIIPYTELADTLIADDDMCQETVNWQPHQVVTVGSFKTFDETVAERFTRISQHGDPFIENKPGGQRHDGGYDCWVGPLIFNTSVGQGLFEQFERDTAPGTELKVSGAFNALPNAIINVVKSTAVDIGTSTSLVEVSNA